MVSGQMGKEVGGGGGSQYFYHACHILLSSFRYVCWGKKV